MIRKLTPYLLFAAPGLAMLAGAQYGPALITKFYHAVTPAADWRELPAGTRALAALGDPHAAAVVDSVKAVAQQNATGAEAAAGQQASGWVPSATVASKFITAAGAFLLAVLLIWQVQKLTHPGPTRWAKQQYTTDFDTLPVAGKFEVYQRLRLHYVLLVLGALVFAALVA